MTSKQDTRKVALNQRDSLTVSVRAQKSRVICGRLLRGADDWIASNACSKGAGLRIAAYEPMRSEVDVHPLLQASYERGWDVFLPCMVRAAAEEPARMVFFPISQEQLAGNRPAFLDHPARPFPLDDLHAQGWREADPKLFDIAVIPMVAFDKGLMRLGYGGGNYDRFLPLLRPDCFVAGVAFEEQRVDCVPTEPHDLPLPRIYTA